MKLSLGIACSLFGTLLIACFAPQQKPDSFTRAHVSAAERVSLFNGKDLSGWYTYQRKPEPTSTVEGLKMENGQYVEPIGLNRDPLQVFTVVEADGEPAIRISGEVFGILVTHQEYENYHLSMEVKFRFNRKEPRSFIEILRLNQLKDYPSDFYP